LREPCDVISQFQGCVENGAWRRDPIHQTHPQGFGRIHRAARQQEIHGAAVADESWETDGPSVDQRHTPAPIEETELRVAGRDTQVTPKS
jgi:hypothetical protein